MKKTLIFAAAIASAAFTANAATLVEEWTIAGGAWSWADDAFPGSGTVNSDGNGNGTLTVANGYVSQTGGNFQHLFFYSGHAAGSNPSISLSSSELLSGVQTIYLIINFAGSFDDVPTLTFGNLSGISADYTPAPVPSGNMGGFVASTYTFGWDVSSLAGTTFQIDFSLPPHAAFDSVQLIQDTNAIPEPSTYALILGGVILGGVAIARRRRA